MKRIRELGFLKTRFDNDVYRIWLISTLDLPRDIIRSYIAPLLYSMELVVYTRFDRKNRKVSQPVLINPYKSQTLYRLLPESSTDSSMYLSDDKGQMIRVHLPESLT